MFQNEIEFDHTTTTVLDETDTFEDVKLIIGEEIQILQWNDVIEDYDMILLSHEMFNDLIEALHNTEGFFKIEK